MLRGNPVQAASKLQTAVDHLRQINYAGSHIHCIKGLAYLKIFGGDYASAEVLLDETLALATSDGDLWQRSVARVVRGVLEVLRSDAPTAREYLTTALIAARAAGDPRHIALTLNYQGVTALSLKLFDEAERSCRECLSIAAENKDRFQMSLALLSLGRVALSRGDAATSAWMFAEGHGLAREIGDRWLEAQARGYMGTLAVHQGNHTQARTHFHAAVTIAAAAPLPFALDALAMLAEFELDTQPQVALTALAYVRRHPRTRSVTRASAEARWQEVAGSTEQKQLADAEEAAALYSHGQHATLLALFESSV
jgi:tetratricopeptide (TPR) repeat protein